MVSRISISQVESSERFYRIPKIFTDENSYYNSMRLESKFAYGLLKDRFELSIQNRWVDKENNVYWTNVK
ncbi:replication initiator protein A [Lactococcus taiwanensis]|uniref:replication initiator protein A n=1 Tax=Lactococcus taiwanensis TaxID=1151742 RepID=UPI003511E6F1